MKQKRRVGQRLERAMQLPEGVLTGTAFMEIEGNTRAVVIGCRGIQTYTEERICLRTAVGTVSFYGRDMEMGCLSTDGATVTGTLQRIEFDAGGDD